MVPARAVAEATSSTLRLGQVLFRFRSFTPVPVIALLAWLLWRGRGASAGAAEPFLHALGPLVALAGQAFRFYVLGLVPEGTSGQGHALEASTLNTRGPYAHVRNPLYVGNLLIVLGLLLFAHDVLAAVLALAFFFGEYFFIIRAEESFLRQRFGAAFDAWCQHVHRWVPRLRPWAGGTLRPGGYDWKRALKKEHNPFTAWTTGLLALWAFEAWARGALDARLAGLLLGLEAAVLLFFVGVKGWKHRWLARVRA